MVRLSEILKGIQALSTGDASPAEENQKQDFIWEITARYTAQHTQLREKLAPILAKIQIVPSNEVPCEDSQESTVSQQPATESAAFSSDSANLPIPSPVQEPAPTSPPASSASEPAQTQSETDDEFDRLFNKQEPKEALQIVKELEEDLHGLLKEGSSEWDQGESFTSVSSSSSNEPKDSWDEEMEEFTKGIFDEDNESVPLEPESTVASAGLPENTNQEQVVSEEPITPYSFPPEWPNEPQVNTNTPVEKQPAEEETTVDFWGEDDFDEEGLKLDNVLKEMLGKDSKKSKSSTQDRKRSKEKGVVKRKRRKTTSTEKKDNLETEAPPEPMKCANGEKTSTENSPKKKRRLKWW